MEFELELNEANCHCGHNDTPLGDHAAVFCVRVTLYAPELCEQVFLRLLFRFLR